MEQILKHNGNLSALSTLLYAGVMSAVLAGVTVFMVNVIVSGMQTNIGTKLEGIEASIVTLTVQTAVSRKGEEAQDAILRNHSIRLDRAEAQITGGRLLGLQ